MVGLLTCLLAACEAPRNDTSPRTATAAKPGTPEANWPAWRGSAATGVASSGNPPITWSETKNVKWKVESPAGGNGTPIIWEDKIFIQSAVPLSPDPEGGLEPPSEEEAGRLILSRMPTVPYRFTAICLSRETGEVLWERTVAEAVPHEGHHPSSGFASFSPVTDGRHVWFSFGSRGLHCYDLDGVHKWSRELVQMLTIGGWGEGGSPALAGDAVISVSDHEGSSRIYAFEKLTGELRWMKEREEESAWATPLPLEFGGKMQIVTAGSNRIRSYDAATGDIIWQTTGLTPGVVASPVYGSGNVYCMTGYERHALLAIELGHTGDLSDSEAIVWRIDKNTPYVPSPLLYDDRLYFVEGLRPVFSCYNAITGEALYERKKLPGLKQIYGSPLGVAGRIYLSDRGGATIVLKHSDSFEVLATNRLNDVFDASPVVVGDELFLKGKSNFYCIAKK